MVGTKPPSFIRASTNRCHSWLALRVPLIAPTSFALAPGGAIPGGNASTRSPSYLACMNAQLMSAADKSFVGARPLGCVAASEKSRRTTPSRGVPA